MPSFIWSQALTANQLGFSPLTGWQFEFVPVAWGNGAYVKVLQRATTTGVRQTLTSGSTVIQQRSPVQGGGTAGTTPVAFSTTPVDWIASMNDKLQIADDEVLGGTPTVDGMISVEPF